MKSNFLQQLFTLMKYSLLIIIVQVIGLNLLLADIVNAQKAQSIKNVSISIELSQTEVFNVLKEIESKTDYKFAYNSIDLKKLDNIKITQSNTSVYEILHEIAKQTGLDFKQVDQTINISRSKMKKSGVVKISSAIEPIRVTGIISDEKGEPLIGVTVRVKDSNAGGISDVDGAYSIDAESDATLVFSFVGYTTQEVSVGNSSVLNIQMELNLEQLEEVVVVGYGTQKKVNLTGSVASVNSKDLTTAPVASTTNTLAGRLPGLISQQSDGRPGQDAAALSIRGFGNALVIVDGVESSFNNIDPNQIESVSILKDGSASIYGSRAGNGVILITTKRGTSQSPTIRLNSSYTMQGITTMPKPVNAGQFAELSNEKAINQGIPVPYTDTQVQKYYDGSDPQYPNTDWYSEAIRNWAPQQQHNLSVQGGNEKIKYFGFFGYLDQESMWKKNGGEYERYNLQSNIDAKITENLDIQLLLSSVSDQEIYPSRSQYPGTSSAWQDLWNTLPIYPAHLPDPTKLSYANGSGIGGIPYSTNYEIIGYNRGSKQNFKGQFAANYSFPWLKGLMARAMVNYLKDYETYKAFNKPFDLFTYNPSNDTYTLAASFGTAASIRERRNQFQTITSQFSLNYENTFSNDHYVKAMFLREAITYENDYLNAGRDNFLTPSIEYIFGGAADKSNTGGYGNEMGRASYVGRLNYSYKEKYLIESSIRADASAQFPEEHRWGYFPSVSVGWRLSQEEFARGIGMLDELKIRGSYGSSGQDNVSNYAYLSGYQISGRWLIGNGTKNGIASTGLANPLLTWEEIKIRNIGLDFSLWGSKLLGSFDAFYRNRSGILATRILSLPSTFGSQLPPENINSQNTRGFELMLGTFEEIGDFSVDISGNISWSRSKWDHYEEPAYVDPDQVRINQFSGRWTDVQFGYKSDGLFTSQSEIQNLGYSYPGGNSSLGPGDIKYVDVNNDGVLDWKDQVDIGKGTLPHWMAGLNIRMGYKSFDVSALFQGAFDYYTNVILDHGLLTYPEEVYDLRWNESNNSSSALHPRIGGSSTNYGLLSDFFYKNASYLRLKTLSVGYNVPESLISHLRLKELRFYFAGMNLFTISKLFKDYHVDPEAPTNNAAFYYPQQRTITFGVNVSF